MNWRDVPLRAEGIRNAVDEWLGSAFDADRDPAGVERIVGALKRRRDPLDRARLRGCLARIRDRAAEAGSARVAAAAEAAAQSAIRADVRNRIPLFCCVNRDMEWIRAVLASVPAAALAVVEILSSVIAHDLDVDANAIVAGLDADGTDAAVRRLEAIGGDPAWADFHRFRAFMILFGLFHRDAPEEGGAVYIRSGLAADNERAARYYQKAREAYAAGTERKLNEALKARGLQFAQSLADYRLAIPSSLRRAVLTAKTGLRIELDSCVGNDHVMVSQDIGADIIHVSVVLRDAATGRYDYPIRVRIRRIDDPVLRLSSVDKGVPPTDVAGIPALFDLRAEGANEWLRLSKASVVAAGIVPMSFRDRAASIALADVLAKLGGGLAIETDVRGVPVGSGTGTSSAIAAAILAGLVAFTGQTGEVGADLSDEEKMLVIARVLLVEQLIGALGGWQDPCAIFPGIKLLHAEPADLLPTYRRIDVPEDARRELMRRLKLTDAGYRQPSQAAAWQFTGLWAMRLRSVVEARMDSRRLVRRQIRNLETGDIAAMGPIESADWSNRQVISPKATNAYIERVVAALRERLGDGNLDFDACGARGGAGGCFWIDPSQISEARFAEEFGRACAEAMEEHRARIRFEGDPRIYDYAINNRGLEMEIGAA